MPHEVGYSEDMQSERWRMPGFLQGEESPTIKSFVTRSQWLHVASCKGPPKALRKKSKESATVCTGWQQNKFFFSYWGFIVVKKWIDSFLFTIVRLQNQRPSKRETRKSHRLLVASPWWLDVVQKFVISITSSSRCQIKNTWGILCLCCLVKLFGQLLSREQL